VIEILDKLDYRLNRRPAGACSKVVTTSVTPRWSQRVTDVSMYRQQSLLGCCASGW